MMTKEAAEKIVAKFGKSANDSGSPAVQVALITERIKNLTPHFEKHKKDHHGMRGMLKLIGQRKALLKYLNEKNPAGYQKLIQELGLRK